MNNYQSEKPDMETLVSIMGIIDNIVYQNEDNGYTVCEIDADGELITAVGTMPFTNIGEAVTLIGDWVTHPTYGKQFKVEYFEKRLPTDENSILKYLSSHAIHGIGPKLAARIVQEFGEATFEVIENSPHLLAEIKGITQKHANEITMEFKEQFGSRSVMLFFTNYFGMSLSNRIYKKFGASAVDIVKENPYVLCDSVNGIGFERADNLAASLGYGKDSQNRICAALKYILRFNSSSNGHVYLPREKLIQATSKLIETPPSEVDEAIKTLETNGQLIIKDRAVYLPSGYNAEKYCAMKLALLSKINVVGTIDDIDSTINKTEVDENIKYAPLQRDAIKNAITHAVSILTGGPGTGKTTIIKAIIKIFDNLGFNIALAAPTGRAAKRMSQATAYEAKTIHRLLEMEYSGDENGDAMKFFRNENNLLEFEVVIIDEASMIDIYLFTSLLKALKPGVRLILIGDSDQLQSVGAGEVLRDVIESKMFAVCRLDQIFRQAQKSLIILNAHRINKGEYPDLECKNSDFFFMERHDPSNVVNTIADLIKTRLPKTYGDDIYDKIQVITSTRKGTAGTYSLNILLQNVLNPPSYDLEEHKYRETLFRENDKIIQTKNNYDIEWYKNDSFGNDIDGLGVFNGDIGIIEEIDKDEETIKMNFDGRIAKYTFDMLDSVEHAYAITVHKSQGSEYPVVIMPVCATSPMLQTRNLLYTAITRAQSMVILVGDREVIHNMVDNNRHSERYTGLKEMLKNS